MAISGVLYVNHLDDCFNSRLFSGASLQQGLAPLKGYVIVLWDEPSVVTQIEMRSMFCDPPLLVHYTHVGLHVTTRGQCWACAL